MPGMTDTTSPETFPADLIVTDTSSNDEILAHAETMFARYPEQEFVIFSVSYVEGDQDRGGKVSEPEPVTVQRDGRIGA